MKDREFDRLRLQFNRRLVQVKRSELSVAVMSFGEGCDFATD